MEPHVQAPFHGPHAQPNREDRDACLVCPAGRFEDREHRLDRVGPAGFPIHAFEGLQRPAPRRLVLQVEPFAQRVGQHLPYEAVAPRVRPVAEHRQLHGRILAAGAGLAVSPRMRGQAGPLNVEYLYLEGTQADEHVTARVGRVRGIAVPAVERDHAVLVGPHAPLRDRVEALGGQGQQCAAVLREQADLLLVLGVVGFPAEFQASAREPGVEVLQVPHVRLGNEELAADHADLRLDRALLVSGVRGAQGAVESVVRLERLEQAGPADPAAGPASHARGVVEHDAFGHAPEPFEQVQQRLARALRVLAGHELRQADVRVREVQHEMAHALDRAPVNHVNLAEIGLGLARMPYQIHERVAGLHGGFASEPGHGPGHGRQRHLDAVLVAQTLPYPGSGVPLLAPVAAVPREPLLDQGQVRVDHRPASFPYGWFLGQVIHPKILSHRGLAHVLLARYRRYGFAVPSHTADRLYLGHADHLPFRPFLLEI